MKRKTSHAFKRQQLAPRLLTVFLAFVLLTISGFGQQMTRITDTVKVYAGTSATPTSWAEGVVTIQADPECLMTNTNITFGARAFRYCMTRNERGCDAYAGTPGLIDLYLLPTGNAATTTPTGCRYNVNYSGPRATWSEKWNVPYSVPALKINEVRDVTASVPGLYIPVTSINFGALGDGCLTVTSGAVGSTACGAAGEPAITPGTTAQYWRGDKTWQTLSTAVVSAMSGLYEVPLTFTSPLSRSTNTISITGLSTVGTANYIPGVNSAGNAWEYKQLIEGANVTITHGAGSITIASTGGGGVSDGDKGDIVISGSGTVYGIDAGVIVDADVNASAAIALSKLASVTASRVLVSDGSGFVSASAVTSTTLGYLDATSSVQTQLNARALTTTTISAGSGMTGGGDLSSNRTLTLNINGGVTQTCSGTDKVSAITALGIVTCSADTGGGSGAGGYSATYSSVTSVTVTAVTHGFGTSPLIIQVYDGAGNPKNQADYNVSWDDSTGEVVLDFAGVSSSGRYVIFGGGTGTNGTVTTVSVVSANGLAGSVANATTTPAITLTTTVTGMLKGNGTAISAAVAGTDYVEPGGALGTPSSGVATNLTGTASGLTAGAATALVSNPADCGTRLYARQIAASGDLTCFVTPDPLLWVFDGGGATITAATGVRRYVRDACTIDLAMISSHTDTTGSVTVEIEKAAYTTGTPSWSTISNSFSVSSAQAVKDTTLTGWTLPIAADTFVRAKVTGTPSGFTNIQVKLECN